MKKPNVFVVFMIFGSVLPSNSEAKALPRASINHRSIQNFIHSPLQMRERTLKKEKYENTNVRKSNGHTIPIYLIMSPKASQRIVDQSPMKLENLFDDKGMIYVTNPKPERYQQPGESILVNIGRRSQSRHGISKKNERALRSYMNQELNRQILAKTAQRRFIEKYDKEYKFDDLVM